MTDNTVPPKTLRTALRHAFSLRGGSAAFALSALALLATGCNQSMFNPNPATNIAPQALLKTFSPLPQEPQPTGQQLARVNLGRQLYYETHLSENDSISCNSCHHLDQYGADLTPVSHGHNGKPGGRNAPTVYNSGLQFVQFWDGRAPDLAAQAAGPMMNPVEMGMSGPAAVLTYIRSNPTYLHEMEADYPGQGDAVTMDNVTNAIASFEEGLLTPSPWDHYLRGDESALTPDQKQGLRVFLKSGCASCHNGVDLGGNSYEELGAAKAWPDTHTDTGREAITKSPADAMYFKVPVLRNIAKTGPYFHTGQVKTLDEAVRLMGTYEAGEKLSDADVKSIVTFLNSLTGTLPQPYIAPPVRPAPTMHVAANTVTNTRQTVRQGGE